ncbi:exonuclease domain-containing protein [Asticcacaulis solisilvae]|uniref:exonuclease domain-containing protein n=1 Tax=Asticcacaulis solisilvae TaxID=1217274 RepID=UPI003FD80481
MSRTFPVLPPTYYRDHFLEMVGFVTSVYGEMLGEAEHDFVEGFLELSEAAQCLFVRMSNRKRQVFTFDDLDYGEIGDVAGGLDDLLDSGFARRLNAADYRAVLDAMTKPDVVEVARRHGLEIKTGWAKGRLVEHLLSHLPFADFASDFDLSGFVAPGQRDTLGFLLYLYFGRLNENLLSFTLRDLGVVSVREQDSYRARFHSLGEARGGYVYTAIVRALKSGEADIDALFDQLDALPEIQADFIEALRNTMLFLLGQGFEKRRDVERAIAVYERATAFDSRERVVRLLHGRGETDRVRAMLEAMLDSPADDEEFIFADDFYRRKFDKVRTSVFTDLLRTSEIIEVDELYRGFAEEAAIRHFAADGWSAHHTENGLWPSLFGLVFWDELFETGGMSSGFDLVPQCLKDRSFHRLFTAQIEAKLARVRGGQGLDIVRDTVMNHAGDDNGIVWWSDSLGPVMAQLLMSAPPEAVAAVLKRMSEDFYALRDGFPDLMLTRDGQIRFVEIKAEGDAVRRHQLARLNLLKGLGFAADIARVKYRIDPDQTYVVVDVETTGGRPPNDRVTEIGAVKIRGGQVVDEWHSLINPQRHIPGFITDLTGISNAMVADAPLFADVAESFAAFLQGAVFVAHNVNFDHGFIGAEFRRLDMRFRLPKLCTVSSMRKYYPGHESYSLGRLCQVYGIRLENHHRALDDARAAAELLLLINERRLKAA